MTDQEDFEAHLKTAVWHQVLVLGKDDDDDGASVYRMCKMAAKEAWKAAKKHKLEGMVLAPICAPNEVISAIEREIDSQLAASGMTQTMHRQDGQYVWDAAIAALAQKED